MRRRAAIAFAGALCSVVCAWGAFAAEPTPTPEQARAFFERYVALGHAFDPDLAELYADDAVIEARRVYPGGEERVLRQSGAQWKRLVRKAMPLARAQDDRSEYENARFERVPEGIEVRARRYSVRKCYWDPTYSMTVARDAEGRVRIVAESFRTQSHSGCEGPGAAR